MHKTNFFLMMAAFFALACAATVFAADEKEEESLWGYADPSADVTLYINTKQAEKAMDKSLWKKISKEKNSALEEKSEDMLFDTKDRDLELVLNLRILSPNPFCGTLDGVANISGDLNGDIGKLLNMLKTDAGATPEKNTQNEMDFYSFALMGEDNASGIDCMFVPVKPNQVQFRIGINPTDSVPQKVLSRSSEPSPAIQKLSSQELSFACVVSPEKLAGLEFKDDAKEVGDFLKQVGTIVISVYVTGKQMMLNGTLSFKSEEASADFMQRSNSLLSNLDSVAGSETHPRIDLNGKDVNIEIPINISDVWDLVSDFASEKFVEEDVEEDEDLEEVKALSDLLNPKPEQ